MKSSDETSLVIQSLNSPGATPVVATRVATAGGLFDLGPRELVNAAGEMAGVLAEVIEKQRLFETIQGKRHVKIDGWLTLGTMLGISAREVSCDEQEDGSVVAKVELYSIRSGQVIGSASALCGVEEKRWAKAERYARRSMAVTRATGKAYRNNFAWILALAGFETTPEAEMPRAEPERKGFDPQNRKHQDALIEELKKRGAPEGSWDDIALKMIGKTMAALDEIMPAPSAGIFEQ